MVLMPASAPNRVATSRSANARRRAPGKPVSRGNTLAMLLILAMLVGATLGRIHLERQTSRMGEEWRQTRERVTALEKQRDNLVMERESHTHGQYILARAREMGLGPPASGQVRRLSLTQAPAVPAPETTEDRSQAVAERR